MKSYRDLDIYKESKRLAIEIHKISLAFPKHEMYEEGSQIRRSSVSVAANIAEGFRKKGPADKVRFFNISQGSLSETEYYLMLAQDLDYTDMGELLHQADEVGRILEAYMTAIKK